MIGILISTLRLAFQQSLLVVLVTRSFDWHFNKAFDWYGQRPFDWHSKRSIRRIFQRVHSKNMQRFIRRSFQRVHSKKLEKVHSKEASSPFKRGHSKASYTLCQIQKKGQDLMCLANVKNSHSWLSNTIKVV